MKEKTFQLLGKDESLDLVMLLGPEALPDSKATELQQRGGSWREIARQATCWCH